jgi:(p)ppGpp synthase/HD superfamily hydrolase
MDIVSRARDLAHRAHAGQVDKAGRPYIEHVARVAAACADDPVAEAVAWLHDVLEDNPVFFTRDVEPNFDWHPILESVCVLSRNMWDNNRQYYSIIRENPIALRVKLADIADNADEARLALLDPETAERLRRKYAKARRALGGE